MTRQTVRVTVEYSAHPTSGRSRHVVRWVSAIDGKVHRATVPTNFAAAHPRRDAIATALQLGEIISGTHSDQSDTRNGATITEAGGEGVTRHGYTRPAYRVALPEGVAL